MSQILGDPLALTGFWLVHQFPTRAPPGYVRSGYVLDPAWLIERVTNHE